MRIFRKETTFEFLAKRRVFGALSSIMCGASILLIIFKGLNYGIDFSGGMEIQVKFGERVGINEVRSAIEAANLKGASVQSIGKEGREEYLIRFQTTYAGIETIYRQIEEALLRRFGQGRIKALKYEPEKGSFFDLYHDGSITREEIKEVIAPFPDTEIMEGAGDEGEGIRIMIPDMALLVKRALDERFGEGKTEMRRIEAVGPRVGEELKRNGIIAVIASLIMILIYIGFRFEISFSPGAVIALAHDVLITLGIFSLLGKEFNLTTIAALLTIIGYSLNDTIVIYDRIRENMWKTRKHDLIPLIDRSINQTLSRTLLTSGTTFLAVLAIFIFGTGVLVDFSLALMIGIIAGTYSTIYIASPVMLILQRAR